MATETTTGKIESINANRVTGTVFSTIMQLTYDYDDPNFPSNANVGDEITFDIDFAGRPPVATNIKLATVVDPNYPADIPGQILIDTLYAGDLEINSGQVYMVRGAEITGSVNMNGGTLILSSTPDGAIRSRIKCDIDGKVVKYIAIYKSDVDGNIDIKEVSKLSVFDAVINGIDVRKGDEINIVNSKIKCDIDGKEVKYIAFDGNTVEGSISIKSGTESAKIINSKIKNDIDGKENLRIELNDSTIDGEVSFKGNNFASVSGCVIGGDLVLKDNTTCTSVNNTVTGENRGCI